MIAIIDYDAGNLKSVEKALTHLGEECVVTRDHEVLLQADALILPGVGAFGVAMKRLEELQLPAVIRRAVLEQKKPLLGICLGLQLLFEESEESPGVRGLSLLKGRILRLPEGEGRKIPEIGWNDLTFPRETRLFRGIEEGVFVYFVHSYYLKAEDPSVVAAETVYGARIHAAVEKDNLFACQFHPEKSGEAGLRILENFIAIAREGSASRRNEEGA